MDGNVICNIGRNKFAVRNMKNQNFEISECWDPSDRHFRVLEPFQASFYNKQNNMNCLRYHKKVFHQKLGSRMDAPIFVFNQVYSMRSEPNFDLPKTNFDLPNANFDLPKPKFKLRNTNFKMRDTNFNPLKSICAPPPPPLQC